MAPPASAVFFPTVILTADLSPYAAVPSGVPLDELNPPLSRLKGAALHWAKKSLELAFDREDEADEQTLNRILWHSIRGYGTPYPARPAARPGGGNPGLPAVPLR
jgi:hypothetical protein